MLQEPVFEQEKVGTATSLSNMYQDLVKFALVFAVPTIIIVLYLWRANEKRRLPSPVEETNTDGGTKSITI